MTDEEYIAKAMLLGMEYMPTPANGGGVFRKRVATGRVYGTAIYDYFDRDTLEVRWAGRSEVDKPLLHG
jgi:hypothetical protein